MGTEQANLPVVNAQSTVPSKWGDDVFGTMSGTVYLPRLQLFGANSDAVKKRLIGMGDYGIVKARDIKSLGMPVDILPLEWRPKAMSIKDDAIEVNYDPSSDRFKEIATIADTVTNSGCMFGPEFLVWIPNEGFATFFLSSKSARYEADNFRKLKGRMAMLESILIEGSGKNKGRSWHAPRIKECLTPYTFPSIEEIDKQVQDFLNPKEFTPEEATPDVAARG
jgi:hypothetical protein